MLMASTAEETVLFTSADNPGQSLDQIIAAIDELVAAQQKGDRQTARSLRQNLQVLLAKHPQTRYSFIPFDNNELIRFRGRLITLLSGAVEGIDQSLVPQIAIEAAQKPKVVTKSKPDLQVTKYLQAQREYLDQLTQLKQLQIALTEQVEGSLKEQLSHTLSTKQIDILLSNHRGALENSIWQSLISSPLKDNQQLAYRILFSLSKVDDPAIRFALEVAAKSNVKAEVADTSKSFTQDIVEKSNNVVKNHEQAVDLILRHPSKDSPGGSSPFVETRNLALSRGAPKELISELQAALMIANEPPEYNALSDEAKAELIPSHINEQIEKILDAAAKEKAVGDETKAQLTLLENALKDQKVSLNILDAIEDQITRDRGVNRTTTNQVRQLKESVGREYLESIRPTLQTLPSTPNLTAEAEAALLPDPIRASLAALPQAIKTDGGSGKKTGALLSRMQRELDPQSPAHALLTDLSQQLNKENTLTPAASVKLKQFTTTVAQSNLALIASDYTREDAAPRLSELSPTAQQIMENSLPHEIQESLQVLENAVKKEGGVGERTTQALGHLQTSAGNLSGIDQTQLNQVFESARQRPLNSADIQSLKDTLIQPNLEAVGQVINAPQESDVSPLLKPHVADALAALPGSYSRENGLGGETGQLLASLRQEASADPESLTIIDGVIESITQDGRLQRHHLEQMKHALAAPEINRVRQVLGEFQTDNNGLAENLFDLRRQFISPQVAEHVFQVESSLIDGSSLTQSSQQLKSLLADNPPAIEILDDLVAHPTPEKFNRLVDTLIPNDARITLNGIQAKLELGLPLTSADMRELEVLKFIDQPSSLPSLLTDALQRIGFSLDEARGISGIIHQEALPAMAFTSGTTLTPTNAREVFTELLTTTFPRLKPDQIELMIESQNGKDLINSFIVYTHHLSSHPEKALLEDTSLLNLIRNAPKPVIDDLRKQLKDSYSRGIASVEIKAYIADQIDSLSNQELLGESLKYIFTPASPLSPQSLDATLLTKLLSGKPLEETDFKALDRHSYQSLLKFLHQENLTFHQYVELLSKNLLEDDKFRLYITKKAEYTYLYNQRLQEVYRWIYQPTNFNEKAKGYFINNILPRLPNSIQRYVVRRLFPELSQIENLTHPEQLLKFLESQGMKVPAGAQKALRFVDVLRNPIGSVRSFFSSGARSFYQGAQTFVRSITQNFPAMLRTTATALRSALAAAKPAVTAAIRGAAVAGRAALQGAIAIGSKLAVLLAEPHVLAVILAITLIVVLIVVGYLGFRSIGNHQRQSAQITTLDGVGGPGDGVIDYRLCAPGDPSCPVTFCDPAVNDCSWPVDCGCISQGPYDTFSHGSLNAIDIGMAQCSSPVLAHVTHHGRVIGIHDGDQVGSGSGYGNYVKVEICDQGCGTCTGTWTLYGHLQPGLLVSMGQCIDLGAPLGWVDHTGFSTGSHLHYEYGSLSGSVQNINNIVPPYSIGTCL